MLNAVRQIPPERALALYTEHLAHVLRGIEAALATSGFEAAVFPYGSYRSKSRYDDQDFPFRSAPHAEYLLPLGEPEAVLVVRPGKAPALFRRAQTSFWEKPAPFAHPWMLDARAFEVRTFDDAETLLAAVVTLAGEKAAVVGEDASVASRFPAEHRDPAPFVTALHELRTRKTAWEIEALAVAGARAAAGHRAVAEAFFAGRRSELDLHLVYLAATAQDDSETPYKNIVALGRNASILHHISYGRTATEDRSLLVDAGAPHAGYGSDITRTWVRRDRAGTAAAWSDLVGAVDRMQLALVAAAKPGLDYEALHDACHDQLASILIEHGLAKGAPKDLVSSGVTRAFFPHGLGHHLGLQTHDVAGKPRPPRAENRYLRNTRTIENGQVFTIEPGLYFIDALLGPLRKAAAGDLVLWSEVERLSPFGGVRIEDNIAIVDGAPRNLTRGAIPQGDGSGL